MGRTILVSWYHLWNEKVRFSCKTESGKDGGYGLSQSPQVWILVGKGGGGRRLVSPSVNCLIWQLIPSWFRRNDERETLSFRPPREIQHAAKKHARWVRRVGGQKRSHTPVTGHTRRSGHTPARRPRQAGGGWDSQGSDSMKSEVLNRIKGAGPTPLRVWLDFRDSM